MVIRWLLSTVTGRKPGMDITDFSGKVNREHAVLPRPGEYRSGRALYHRWPEFYHAKSADANQPQISQISLSDLERKHLRSSAGYPAIALGVCGCSPWANPRGEGGPHISDRKSTLLTSTHDYI